MPTMNDNPNPLNPEYVFARVGAVADAVFKGASCQQDLDARLMNFIKALRDSGIGTPRVGKVLWNTKPGEPPISIEDWMFEIDLAAGSSN